MSVAVSGQPTQLDAKTAAPGAGTKVLRFGTFPQLPGVLEADPLLASGLALVLSSRLANKVVLWIDLP